MKTNLYTAGTENIAHVKKFNIYHCPMTEEEIGLNNLLIV